LKDKWYEWRQKIEERVVIFLLIGYILGMLTVIFVMAPKKS
jgi:hypothetical protein